MKKIKELLKKHENTLMTGLYIFIVSVFLTLIVLDIQYGKTGTLDTIIMSHLKVTFFTYTYIQFINIGLYFLFSSVRVMFSLSTLTMILLSFVNQQKLLLRNEVLVPADFLQIKEATSMVTTSVKLDIINNKTIIMFVLLIALFLLSFAIKKIKLKIITKIFTTFIFMLGMFQIVFASQTFYSRFMIFNIWDNQAVTYDNTGFLIAFTKEISNMLMKKPDNYNSEYLSQIYSSNEASFKSSEFTTDINGEKTNIIVILSESLTDPTLLNGVTYSEDPLYEVRDEMEKFGYMNLVSPQAGGGTANVEYEVLTGTSVSLFPASSIVYQQFMHNDHMSLARYLDDYGYDSVGIHPNNAWFWRRDKVYPYLGFDNFYSYSSMNNLDFNGIFVSDESVSKEIIEKVDESNNSIFVSGISMENHGGYETNRYDYDENSIEVYGDISDNLKKQLKEYVNGVKFASESFQMLFDYFENVEEPTYIIIYGDHIPFMGSENMEYYHLLGYNENDVLNTDIYSRKTPVIFWSNQDKEYIEPNYISPFFLSKEILKYADIPLTGYYQYLDEVNEFVKVYGRVFMMDSDYNILLLNNDLSDYIKNLNLVSYDINFGKNYLGLK